MTWGAISAWPSVAGAINPSAPGAEELEDVVVELQALEAFVRMARERQAARDDAVRRRRAMAERQTAAANDGRIAHAVPHSSLILCQLFPFKKEEPFRVWSPKTTRVIPA